MLMSLLIEVYSSSNRTLHTDWYHTDTTDLAGVKHPLLRFNGKVVKATAKKDIENYLKCKKKKKKMSFTLSYQVTALQSYELAIDKRT